MPNIPYISPETYEPKQLIDDVVARRGCLLNLDKILLHSPVLAAGWGTFMGTIRTGLTIDHKLRELAICAVGVLNHAGYEVHHHLPILRAAGGTVDQIAALLALDSSPALDVFSEEEQAILQLATEMTRNVQVKPETMERLRRCAFTERQLVELVATVAAYNMGCRVIVAAGLEIEEDVHERIALT